MTMAHFCDLLIVRTRKRQHDCLVCRLFMLQNGKLLKVWGRFQEWVLHDPHRAARSYAEAIKRGLGDNMLNLTSEYTAAV